MKECYFTSDNIDEKAYQMAEDVAANGRKRKSTFLSQKAALLIIDMQDYFLSKASHAFIPSSPAIIQKIIDLRKEFEMTKRPTIFTRHLNTTRDAGMMGTWWSEIIERENPLSRITALLDSNDGIVIEKPQYDAFYSTSLEAILHARNIKQLVICGVIANLCCETTARAAFVRGFEVFFAIDGTAAYNADLHRATLLNLSHGFATNILTDDLLARMRK